MQERPRLRVTARTALTWGACAAALGLFAKCLSSTDWAKTWEIVGRAGPLVALCALPYLAAITIDALAWRHVFRAMGRDVSHRALVRVRLACEAVSMSLPAGAVFAESMTPSLVLAHTGERASVSVAAMAGKKWLTMRAHGLYVAIAAAVGFATLSRMSVGVIHARGLPWLVLGLGAIPLVLSVALSTSLAKGAIAKKLFEVLSRVPSERLRAWLSARRTGFRNTDDGFSAIAKDKKNTGRATLLYVAAWLVESVETLVILRVLGADVGLGEALSIEAGLSVVRSLAFFAPAGVGVQDVGYVAGLGALGLPDAAPLAAAFVLVKRGKELAWIAVGYALVLWTGMKARSSAPSPMETIGA